jgi:hypothetical protein
MDASSDPFVLENELFFFVSEFYISAFEALFRHLIKSCYFCYYELLFFPELTL